MAIKSKKMEFNDGAVARAVDRYSSTWSTLDPDRRILAEKITMLTEYAGGRTAAAEAMGVGGTTVDNYRRGTSQPGFYELLALARAARHDWRYLVGGSSFQDWADQSIHDLRPDETEAERLDREARERRISDLVSMFEKLPEDRQLDILDFVTINLKRVGRG